ncbi:hypothetical protein HDU80_003700, partial [Chytriomyces hyalinus]
PLSYDEEFGFEWVDIHTQPQANENASSSAASTSAVMPIGSSNASTATNEASSLESSQKIVTNTDDSFSLNAVTQATWTQVPLSYDEKFGVEWDNNQINDADVPQKNLLA